MPDRRLRAWLARHESAIVFALVAAAVALRALLVVASPTPFGYVWDFYHDGVQVLFTQRRLPVAADCWQCYHPPVFYLLGWPLYALGRALSSAPGDELAVRMVAGLSLPAAAIAIWYGYRLLRLFGCRGASLVGGLALLLVCPALFISSYGAEADIVLTAILSAFVFYLTRYWSRPVRAATTDVLLIGLLAGLAAATKYSGLVALASAGVLIALRIVTGPLRRRALRDGLLILVVCILVGGWKYQDNVRRFGTPLHANGSATEGLSLGLFGNRGGYEFTTLRIAELRELFATPFTTQDLTDYPVYRSVPTTLHAQVWSDMSFFSARSRHGSPGDPYPRKQIPVDLVMAVILLGFVPEALAAIGLVVSLRRRMFLPLAVFSAVTLAAYVYWLLPQQNWALKTKYILCLLPIGVVYAMTGQAWLSRRLPWVGLVTMLLMGVLVAIAHVYLYAFAAGAL